MSNWGIIRAAFKKSVMMEIKRDSFISLFTYKYQELDKSKKMIKMAMVQDSSFYSAKNSL